jgi:hypothetical protein
MKKTKQDIPASERTGLLETAKKKLTGKEGQRGSVSNKYTDQEEGVADPIFDRAKEKFDRTFFETADSPLHGAEVTYGELGNHYLTGAVKEHGGRRWLQAFKPWTEEELAQRKAYMLEARKKLSPDFKKYSGQKPEILDPGDLGNYTYLPEDSIVSTGRRVVEPKEAEPLFKMGDKIQFQVDDWRRGIPAKEVGEVVDDIGGSIGDTITIKWPSGKTTHEWPHDLKGLVETAKKKLGEERGSISSKKTGVFRETPEVIDQPFMKDWGNKEVSLSDALSIKDREKIYSRLMTSPERKELLNPDRLGELENVFAQLPEGTKAHLFGSIVSDKPNPKDLDILLELPGVADWMRAQPWFASAKGRGLPRISIPKVDLIPSPPLKDVPNNMKKIMETGKARYGKDYDIIRILSALGVLSPLSGMLGGEAQAQEVTPDWRLRPDGTPKGPGWLGTLKNAQGKDATEESVGVGFDGQERLIPTLVPTLTQEEVNHILQGGGSTNEILRKAVEHARMLLDAGKSPFLGKE